MNYLNTRRLNGCFWRLHKERGSLSPSVFIRNRGSLVRNCKKLHYILLRIRLIVCFIDCWPLCFAWGLAFKNVRDLSLFKDHEMLFQMHHSNLILNWLVNSIEILSPAKLLSKKTVKRKICKCCHFTASVTVETQEYWNLKPDIDASAAQLNSPV